jgi:ankyrin repeat protein
MANLNPQNVNDLFKSSRYGGDWNPIYWIIEYGSLELLDHIITLGANVNLPSGERYYTTPLIRGIYGNRKMVDLLLHRGANVNARDSGGKPALYYAISHNFIDAARVLIDYGASIDFDLGENTKIPEWVAELVAARELRRRSVVILIGMRQFNRYNFYGNGMDVMRLIGQTIWNGRFNTP